MPVTTSDLTAFCDVCPAADEVTAALAPLGFTLAFQMKEDHQHSYLAIAPLPAQFHYQDAHGTEVIYLEGSDAYLGDEDEMDRGAFPPHASRFWLYAGSNVSAYEQTTQALTATWALPWVPLNAIPVEHLPALDSAA